jgi:hypothetical protein
MSAMSCLHSKSLDPCSSTKNSAKGSMASILLETGQSDDCNLMRHSGTTDGLTNTGPTDPRRALVSGPTGGVPQ